METMFTINESIPLEQRNDLKRSEDDAQLPSIVANTENSAKRHKEGTIQAEQPPLNVPRDLTDREKQDIERRRLKALRDAAKEAEKQRKLAEREAEKQRKSQEKQAKKEAKEAERLKKEAEKQLEVERKEAEKRAQKERREAERQQKELEKQQREAEKQAEKQKKEAERLRAQPRINLFFKSTPAAASPKKDAANQNGQEVDQPMSQNSRESIDNSQDSAVSGDYQQHILPFHAKAGGQLFSSICNISNQGSEEQAMDPLAWSSKRNANREPLKTEKLGTKQFQSQLALAHESAQIAELLTKSRLRRSQFSHLSQRYIADPSSLVPINEEYRPPYVGTTHDLSGDGGILLSRMPFRTDLDPNLYYEYDSEVEWDANDEGEDLRDDDGDDSDDEMEDQEELREFSSSDDDSNGATSHTPSTERHKSVGPLNPVVLFGPEHDLSQFAVQLLGNISLIDTTESKVSQNSSETGESLGIISSVTVSDSGSQTDSQNHNKQTSFEVLILVCTKVGREDLKASLSSHNNSTGTKTLIVELLKQRFPQASASEIRQVFDICMERVGKKRNEKRWVLTAVARQFFDISEFN